MKPEEAKAQLENSIAVTNQMVTYAKSFILKNFKKDTKHLLDELLQSVEVSIPDVIVIHPSVETKSMVRQAADAISWKLAGCESIWGLISNSLIIPGSNNLIEQSLYLNWTTVVPGSGGITEGWQLDHLTLPVPSHILKPFSLKSCDHQPLSDPDLYMHEISIENLGQEIEEALRESVKCFKHELYLGCLALLGKASEGAWIELGLSLVKAVPEDATIDAGKYVSIIKDPFVGIGKKIIEVLKLYERKDIFEQIYKESKYNIKDLRNAVIWADAVRESRNSVHYGVEPSMSNSYEKVAALLIGAVPHLKVLYAIICAIREQNKNID